jgi:hypothetical protein
MREVRGGDALRELMLELMHVLTGVCVKMDAVLFVFELEECGHALLFGYRGVRGNGRGGGGRVKDRMSFLHSVIPTS